MTNPYPDGVNFISHNLRMAPYIARSRKTILLIIK